MKRTSTIIIKVLAVVFSILTITYPIEIPTGQLWSQLIPFTLFILWFSSLWIAVFASSFNQEFMLLLNTHLVKEERSDALDPKRLVLVLAVSAVATILFFVSLLLIEILWIKIIIGLLTAVCSIGFSIGFACNFYSFDKTFSRVLITTSVVPLCLFLVLSFVDYSHYYTIGLTFVIAVVARFSFSEKFIECKNYLEQKYSPHKKGHPYFN